MFYSTMQDLGKKLKDLMDNDERIVIVTADVEKSTKIHFIRDYYPNRIINVGIAEQDMVGTAMGLAYSGMLPIIVAYSTYLTLRPLEQIRSAIGISKLPITLIGTHSGLTGYGPGDRSLEDIGIIRNIDNLAIYTPGFEDEMYQCLTKYKYLPKYIRLPHYNYGVAIPKPENSVSDLRQISKGSRLNALVTYGLGLHIISDNQNVLNDYSVFNLFNQTLSKQSIREKLAEFNKIVIFQDHKSKGSIYGEIVEAFYNYEKSPIIINYGAKNNFLSYGDPIKSMKQICGSLL